VQRDNIVIDGAGHTVEGTDQPYAGLDLTWQYGRSNVTVKNMGIKGWERGIELASFSHITIIENNITNNDYGITFPVGLNKTEIKTFVDGVEAPLPFPIITTNGTHYFIYSEFTLSAHEIALHYAIADIAVTNVTTSKTVIGYGFTISVNITIQSQGNYTITATATTVQGETDTADNTLTDGWVVVTIAGDGDVDRHDFGIFAINYGKSV
jgi:hypothetical protein